MDLTPNPITTDYGRTFRRRVTPWVTCLLCVFLSTLPEARFQGTALLGGMPLIALYFWTVRRPHELSTGAIFAMGLFRDLLVGGQPGFWALIYLTVYAVLILQQTHVIRRSFLLTWMGFGLTAAVAWTLEGVGGTLLSGTWPGINALILPFALSVGIYPVVAGLLAAVAVPYRRKSRRSMS